jgi:hypothetical protein
MIAQQFALAAVAGCPTGPVARFVYFSFLFLFVLVCFYLFLGEGASCSAGETGKDKKGQNAQAKRDSTLHGLERQDHTHRRGRA